MNNEHELIEVWEVEIVGRNGFCVFDNEQEMREFVADLEPDKYTVKKQTMTRKSFNSLGDFEGF